MKVNLPLKIISAQSKLYDSSTRLDMQNSSGNQWQANRAISLSTARLYRSLRVHTLNFIQLLKSLN